MSHLWCFPPTKKKRSTNSKLINGSPKNPPGCEVLHPGYHDASSPLQLAQTGRASWLLPWGSRLFMVRLKKIYCNSSWCRNERICIYYINLYYHMLRLAKMWIAPGRTPTVSCAHWVLWRYFCFQRERSHNDNQLRFQTIFQFTVL